MNLEHSHPHKKIYTYPDMVNDPDSVFISEKDDQELLQKHLAKMAENESTIENKIHFKQKLSDEEWLNLSETMSQVRAIPLDQPELRKEKLTAIKETVAWFEFELGRAEKRIVRRIYDDVPTSIDTLLAICNQELKNLPVSDSLHEKIKSVCQRFFIRNEKIREMRAEFPDDRDLFKQLTTKDPTGPIEILTTPVSFYIRAHTFHDFARIYNLLSFDRFLELDPKHPNILEADQSLGLKTPEAFQPELEHALTAEKAIGTPFTLEKQSIFTHETQHALHKFFTHEFNDAYADTLYEQELRSIQENKTEKYIEILRRLYRRRLDYINEQAKDEILAMIAGGVNQLSEIEKVMNEAENYNYYKKEKSFYTKTPSMIQFQVKKPFPETIEFTNTPVDLYISKQKTARLINENIDLIKESVAKEVFVTEYKRVLHDALRSINKLRTYGFDNELIIKILTHQPLRAWPRRVDRLLVDYNKKPAK